MEEMICHLYCPVLDNTKSLGNTFSSSKESQSVGKEIFFHQVPSSTQWVSSFHLELSSLIWSQTLHFNALFFFFFSHWIANLSLFQRQRSLDPSLTASFFDASISLCACVGKKVQLPSSRNAMAVFKIAVTQLLLKKTIEKQEWHP